MGKKRRLSSQEAIDFGLRYVYGQLINDGFEVLSVRPELDIDPQILANKDEQLYFIIVRTDIYPEVGDMPSISRIQQIREHAEKHSAVTKFISIGLMNAHAKTEEEKSILYKGGEFYVNDSGLRELIRSTAG